MDPLKMTEQRSYLARHLRMVSLQMMEAGGEICSGLDPVLKPTWLSLIGRLGQSDRTTVMDAAREMNVSHVHAQNILKSMKAAAVVSATADPDDGRRTFYQLTKKGLQLVPKVEQIRDAMDAAVDDIEKETGANLFAAVASFRQALQDKDWTTRVKGNLK
jgi:DNA-binding MarR family transcriptional regulator